MPPTAPPDSPWTTLLADAAAPHYVIDSGQSIVFANRALADWVGLAETQILGRRVAYHSEASSPGGDGLLTGLCPRPTAFVGQHGVGSVSTIEQGGRLRRRRAEFLPLPQRGTDDSSPCPVLVACSAADLAPGELAAEPTGQETIDRLHATLQQIRCTSPDRPPSPALIGNSAAAEQLRRQIDAAVTSRADIALVGPVGSGRGELARLVFDRSTSAAGPRLIAIEAGRLEAEQLLDRVAAAIATESAVTLLLQDVNRASTAAQRGVANQLRSAPGVRVLATVDQAAQPLENELAARVATITLQVAPISDRVEDLPLLAQWCVELANAADRKQVAGFTPAALDQLALYSWPGEVAELRAVVAAAHARAATPLIDTGQLPTVIQQAALAYEAPRHAPAPIVLDEFLGGMERELIERALDLSGGNKAEAARLLGMTRPRLYRRMTRLAMIDDDSPGEQADAD